MAKIWHVGRHEVFGNPVDGWETNDTWYVGKITTTDNPLDVEFLMGLKQLGVISKYARKSSFLIDGADHTIIIDSAKDGKPLFILQLAN
jgi:hypothetical protein